MDNGRPYTQPLLLEYSVMLAAILFKAAVVFLAVLAAYGVIFVQPLPVFLGAGVISLIFLRRTPTRRGLQYLDD